MDELEYINDATHPGEFIREELDERGWSQRDLAFILGVAENSITQLLNGKKGISTEMALALADAFSVSADFFNNLQWAYDKSRARQVAPDVSRKARMQSVYPLREMIKRGWIEETDTATLEAQLACFFNVPSLDEVPHLAHAAKKTAYDEVQPNQLAWLFRVKQMAKEQLVPEFSEKKLIDATNNLSRFMADPEELRHIPRILQECGVRFVIVEALPSSKIDGVCFWLDKKSPVIGLSTRHDRIDNFWFVLRHEIEHVLKRHGQEAEIIDSDLDSDDPSGVNNIPDEERIANAAAANFCVPISELDSFFTRKFPLFSERDILGFSGRLGRHPGIVVGQIQKKTGRWNFLRKHLVKVRHYIAPSALVDGWGHIAPVNL
jgi:HTH-type transcriptional regulator/antitoxin HigA